MFIAVARGGDGLVAATLPCRSRMDAEREIRRAASEVKVCDDDICRVVAEKMFKMIEGENVEFEEAIDLSRLTPFQRRVLEEVRRIPRGETVTYGEVAMRAGRPKAARAVGNVLKRNPLPLIIPCHRVVGRRGIGGYTGGIELKLRLLKIEGALEGGEK